MFWLIDIYDTSMQHQNKKCFVFESKTVFIREIPQTVDSRQQHEISLCDHSNGVTSVTTTENDSGHDNIAHGDFTDNTDDDSRESLEDLGDSVLSSSFTFLNPFNPCRLDFDLDECHIVFCFSI